MTWTVSSGLWTTPWPSGVDGFTLRDADASTSIGRAWDADRHALFGGLPALAAGSVRSTTITLPESPGATPHNRRQATMDPLMSREPLPHSVLLPGLPVSRRALLAAGGVAAVGGTGVYLGTRPPTPARQQASAPPTIATSPVAGEILATPPPAPATPPVQKVDPADVLAGASVTDLRRFLDSGAFTIVELVSACLARIEQLDTGEGGLHAVIELNPDAEEIAAGLDAELTNNESRGPLHGIPVMLKDIVATADSMRTTAGSLALADNDVVKDATIVTRLRDAGAVILGKTNLTEWSNFMGAAGQSGFSARGGLTVNPYHLNHSASGSSSGSAVAVSAGYVPLSIGSETNGSILSPATTCGVVGLKPTVGLVSRAGVIPISFSQDSPGPMARSVTDAAIMLSAIAGFDDEDPSATVGEDSSPAAALSRTEREALDGVDYAAALDPEALRGARIGVCRSLFWFGAAVDALTEEAIALMADAGAEIVDEIYLEYSDPSPYVVLLTEFAYGLTEFLETYMPDGPVTSIGEIVEFNYANEDALLGRDQSGLTDALDAGSIEDPYYLETRELRHTSIRENGIDAIMDEFELDALIAPTGGLAESFSSGGGGGSSAEPPSVAGYPSITIPIGLIDGLPAGLHFFGRAFSEQTLLNLAYGLEQALPKREPPTFIPADEPLPSG